MQISLYFCLRSCEYTKTNSHRRSTQFRLRDIQFQDGRGTIPFNSPDSCFINALVVNFSLDTQKNSARGESLSMENTCLTLCFPVVACAHHFLHLHNNDADLNTPMCVYFGCKGAEGKSVTSIHLVALLRRWAGKIGFARFGFHPHKIGSHSLQLCGAMTLHKSGQSDITIKVIVRWRSDAFLIYLQGQVATFTKGVSADMNKVMWFTSTARPPQQTPSSEHCQSVPSSNISTVASKTQSSISFLSGFSSFFQLTGFFYYIALCSTEGQAIKSLFFVIPSTYYLRFYDHIFRLVCVSVSVLQKIRKTQRAHLATSFK